MVARVQKDYGSTEPRTVAPRKMIANFAVSDLRAEPSGELNLLISEVYRILESRGDRAIRQIDSPSRRRREKIFRQIADRKRRDKQQVDLSIENAAYEDFGGEGIGQPLGYKEAIDGLDAITIDDESTDWIASPVLGATQIAEKLKVARTTIDNWRKSGLVIGLKRGPRNYVFPERQFTRSGPVTGIKEIVAQFSDAEEAWEWLVIENPHTNEEAPIDRLHDGHVEEVMRAAEGALDYA